MSTVIAGELGALPLPVPVPDHADQGFPDPALDAIGSFLAAYLTAYVGASWLKVAPGEQIVTRVFTHDPEHYYFKDEELPALFLWRQRSAREPVQLAEDVRVEADELMLFWLLPPAVQERAPGWSRAIGIVAHTIKHALEIGRDPCWVVKGDTDPTATERGSVLLRQAGLLSVKRGRWQFGHKAIRRYGGGGDAQALDRNLYEGLDTVITIEEQSRRLYGVDPDNLEDGAFGGGPLAYPAELQATVTVQGLEMAETRAPVGYAMLYVQDGATAQTIGTTAAKLVGFTASSVSAGLQPDAALDQITVVDDGVYDIQAAFSVLGTAARVAQLRLRKNDVEVPGLGGRAVLAASVGPLAFAPGLVPCEVGDVLTIYAEADADSTSLTVVDGAFVANRIR